MRFVSRTGNVFFNEHETASFSDAQANNNNYSIPDIILPDENDEHETASFPDAQANNNDSTPPVDILSYEYDEMEHKAS